ncbi:MAG: 2Fe-2S ferredoxin [Paenibacillaceae bacterium ZCTH02-B3]|nr:MAG: 2Fe-2S ferredoxin [Paenibacillaceae bacterium ZCTH02-B3]
MDHDQQQESAHAPARRREMTRRQFLSYTLGGAGAFMVGGTILPMIRFAIDPLLAEKQQGEFVKVIEASKVTSEPQPVEFEVFTVDGWHESKRKMRAFVARGDDGRIYALSPVCKHLGCTVDWATHDPNEFFCPCHGARYTRDGEVLAVARGPLDEYEVREENGWVYLGSLKPNSRV